MSLFRKLKFGALFAVLGAFVGVVSSPPVVTTVVVASAIVTQDAHAANEIGYWNNGAGAQTSALFPDEYKAVVTAANAYTATTGDTITAVRIGQSTAAARVIGVALYEYDAGTNRATGPALQTTTISTTGAGTFERTGLTWTLTNGLDYVLVAGDPDSVVNLTADTLTDGTSIDDSGDATFPTWGHTAYQALQIELAGDVTNSGGGGLLLRRRRN
jgi:hypothetical protein